MPKEAIKLGAVDKVLPLNSVTGAILNSARLCVSEEFTVSPFLCVAPKSWLEA